MLVINLGRAHGHPAAQEQVELENIADAVVLKFHLKIFFLFGIGRIITGAVKTENYFPRIHNFLPPNYWVNLLHGRFQGPH